MLRRSAVRHAGRQRSAQDDQPVDVDAPTADRLVPGEATITTHIGGILSKFGQRDLVAAVIIAYESGLIDQVDPGDRRD